MSQIAGSTLTEYLIDQQPSLAVVLRQKIGSQNTHYVHGLRGIQSQVANSAWTEAVSDGLGSVRGWINSAQAFMSSANYDPYGVPSGAVDEFGFTGEMTDANGLVYLRARYYDPNIGNFVSLDPFEGFNFRPMSMNGYSWVEGNIANWSDPTGLCAVWVGLCGTAFAFAGPTGPDDVFACGAAAVCLGSVAELILQISQTFGPEIANILGQIFGQTQAPPQIETSPEAVEEWINGLEAYIDEMFNLYENPIIDPSPFPMPFPAPQFDPNPNRECPEDRDRKCNVDLDDRSAAILYAGIAVQIHNEAKQIASQRGVTNRERRNARFTIAFTRVYSITTKSCLGIGTSSDLYDYMARPTSNGALWDAIIGTALGSSPYVQQTIPQSSPPLLLHAEEKIHRSITNSFDFIDYRAIGISNPEGPCPNCQRIVDVTTSRPRIGYIDSSGIPRTFPS